MQGYIGPFGTLLGFMQFKGDLSVAQESRSSFETTLGGFVSEQRGPRRKRVWAATIDGATYRENAQFKALADGFYGDPPYALALPYQQVTNMLTPAQSLLEPGTWSGAGVTVGGGVLLPDGFYAGRSLLHPTSGTMDFAWSDGVKDAPPVLPGQPITFSVWVRGTGNIQIQWYDYAGANVGAVTSQAYSYATIQRAVITRTPPAGAVRGRLWVSGALQATCPAFTWTADALEWVPGNGANSVTVDSINETPGDSDDALPGWRDSSITFRITEVG